MPDAIVKSQKILSHGEEKNLEQTISDLKDIRDGKEIMQGVNFDIKDRASVDKKIGDLESIKQRHSLPQLSPEERARAFKELEILTADLRVGMPTWKEYEGLRPYDGARYTSLVKWIGQSEADPVRRQKIQRWKTLRRLCDPSDPQAGNIMYLFPQ